MNVKYSNKLLFLSYECPYPSTSGGTLRTMGLLTELNKRYNTDIVVIASNPLTITQHNFLQQYCRSLLVGKLRNQKYEDIISVLLLMIKYQIPYHSALLRYSLQKSPNILRYIQTFQGIVYASYPHWSAIAPQKSLHWILDTHNDDFTFWKTYSKHTYNYFKKIFAILNGKISVKYFKKNYPKFGCIISVCENDRKSALSHIPDFKKIYIVENGIDCSYYYPEQVKGSDIIQRPRILFTGTSAERNMFALRGFIHDTLPLIAAQISNIEFIIAGNFDRKSQDEFKDHKNIRFTGYVDDIRPYFNQSDIYIAPFNDEIYGSKLKIAEAMAMAMPIVSTPNGIKGFSLLNGESVLIAQNPHEFTEAVIKLLSNYNQRQMLGRTARKIALNTIDWKILGDRLYKIVELISDNNRN